MNSNRLILNSNIVGQPIISYSGLHGIVIEQPGAFSKSKMITTYVLRGQRIVKLIAEARNFRVIKDDPFTAGLLCNLLVDLPLLKPLEQQQLQKARIEEIPKIQALRG